MCGRALVRSGLSLTDMWVARDPVRRAAGRVAAAGAGVGLAATVAGAAGAGVGLAATVGAVAALVVGVAALAATVVGAAGVVVAVAAAAASTGRVTASRSSRVRSRPLTTRRRRAAPRRTEGSARGGCVRCRLLASAPGPSSYPPMSHSLLGTPARRNRTIHPFHWRPSRRCMPQRQSVRG
jgi:hypothetical protein